MTSLAIVKILTAFPEDASQKTTRIDISTGGMASPYFIPKNEFEFLTIPRAFIEKVFSVNGHQASISGEIYVSDTLLRYMMMADITHVNPADLHIGLSDSDLKADDASLIKMTPKDADEIIYCVMKLEDAVEITLTNKTVETFLSRAPNAKLWRVLMINKKAQVLLTDVSIPRIMVPDLIRNPINTLSMLLGGYLLHDGQILIADGLVFVTQYLSSKPTMIQNINKNIIGTVLTAMKNGVSIKVAEALSSNTK